MSLYLLRPNYQHRAANVLSSTSEAGLTVGEPTPASGNDGTLRLRCSGTPTAAEAITVELSTGGGPYGYAASGSAAKAKVARAAALKARSSLATLSKVSAWVWWTSK